MKVSILSMQRVENIGSLLQAYSLKKNIESLGCEVSFIDIERREEDDCLQEGYKEQYAYECNWGRGFFSKLKKIDRYTINRTRIKRLSNAQIKLFEKFRKEILGIVEEDNRKEYDVCIIGSDEVFNCNVASNWGFTSQLFGNVKQADKVITYAASCGSTTYDKTPRAVRERISETFKGVSALSVRDENTYEFTSKLTEKNVLCHMDPVVVENFEKEMSECELPPDLPRKCCVVYSYYNRFHDPKEIQSIKQFCKGKGLELVTVGAPQMWIKKHLVVTPFQALKVFQEADFIITDTFHGTIFASKFAKKVAIMTRESNKNKLLDLIKKLELEKHLISSLDQLQDVFELTVDNENVKRISMAEREKTMQYLRGNL